MKWWENTALAELVTGEDEKCLHTTYERLAYHLVNSHGYPGWVTEGRFQVELEAMHDRQHAGECDHSHAKRVEIKGYEPKPKPCRGFSNGGGI